MEWAQPGQVWAQGEDVYVVLSKDDGMYTVFSLTSEDVFIAHCAIVANGWVQGVRFNHWERLA